MCRVLQVHRSGFYAWQREPLSRRAREDQRLEIKIKQFWMESGCNYGYRNITLDLQEAGETCGKNRVLRLMRKMNIASHRRYRRHKGFSGGDLSCVADNKLGRQFDAPLPIFGGSQTLPISVPKRVGCMPQLFWICSLDVSLAGVYLPEQRPNLSWMPY